MHGNPKAEAKAAKAYAKASRAWYMKKRWWLAAVIIVIIGSQVVGGGDDGSAPAADDSSSQSTDSGKKDTSTDEQAQPNLTSGQENALAAAENYLSFTPFSRKGLIEQLSSDAGDKYTLKQATYGVNKAGL